MSWKDLEAENPNLAKYGRQRFGSGIAYLATVSKYGFPRVHPVTPIFQDNELYVFMYPTSPKGKDIQARHYYALHCQVENSDGGKGEFFVRGKGTLVEDDIEFWEAYRPDKVEEMQTKYNLFSLSIEFAFSMVYEGENTIIQKWKLVD